MHPLESRIEVAPGFREGGAGEGTRLGLVFGVQAIFHHYRGGGEVVVLQGGAHAGRLLRRRDLSLGLEVVHGSGVADGLVYLLDDALGEDDGALRLILVSGVHGLLLIALHQK